MSYGHPSLFLFEKKVKREKTHLMTLIYDLTCCCFVDAEMEVKWISNYWSTQCTTTTTTTTATATIFDTKEEETENFFPYSSSIYLDSRIQFPSNFVRATLAVQLSSSIFCLPVFVIII